MKKILIIFGIIIIFSSFFIFKTHKTVTDVSIETAIENVKSTLNDNVKNTITNYNNPKVEEVRIDTNSSFIYFKNKNIDVKGKYVYKIIFNTTQDGLLGPIVYYADKETGQIIGGEVRE